MYKFIFLVEKYRNTYETNRQVWSRVGGILIIIWNVPNLYTEGSEVKCDDHAWTNPWGRVCGGITIHPTPLSDLALTELCSAVA